MANLCHLSSTHNISASWEHSLVLSGNGRVYTFGKNDNGQLGLGDIAFFRTKSRTNPKVITDLYNIIQVSSGDIHSLVLSTSGQIYAFGNEEFGQLGLGDNPYAFGGTKDANTPKLISNLTHIIQISAGFRYSLALDNNGQIYAFGDNDAGQLGLGDKYNRDRPTLIPNLTHIIQIAAGYSHSLALALDNNGQIYAFGYNHNGQLGDNNNRNIPTLISNLTNIIQISSGYTHSLALNNNGQVYAFGNNFAGQLGLGDKKDRNIPIKVMSIF